ncbi:MAG: sensor domain-containing diguanylate cyclase [Betaproteobacteria bacterium]|nr:sensor domain-containing diguanylate cyclase [Betaproteobacteria bacterium]
MRKPDSGGANKCDRIMLDATPLCCGIWDESCHIIDCNQAAVELFGLANKDEYLTLFFELSPEYQPCGGASKEAMNKYLAQAFETGRTRFEWMHRKLDGEPLPSEITLVRIERGNGQGHAVVAYTRDLRELKKTFTEFREANERARIMLDAIPVCCKLWDENHRIIDCNQEMVDLFGGASKQECIERFDDLSPVLQPCGRSSKEMAFEYIEKAFEVGRVRFEWMHQKFDGEPIPAEITLVRVQYGSKNVVAGYIHDLRELKASFAEMQEANERIQIMFDATPLCCNFWDENLRAIDCNQEAVNLFELSSKQEYLDRFFELSPRYQPLGRLSEEMAKEYVCKAFETGRVRFEWMHQKLNGEPIPAEITLVRVKRKDKFVVAGYTRDLRELKETVNLLNKLEKLAFTDNLTGIFNRHYFMEHASRAFIKSEGCHETECLIMFDIDHFKQINDSYGHSAGDAILRGVAEKVQAVLRGDDLFARYGGEEFVIYAPKAKMKSAVRLAERIRKAIASTRFTYGSHEIRLTISLGVTERAKAENSFETFINLADSALYAAKDKGRNRVECR